MPELSATRDTLLRDLLEAAPDAMIVFRPDGRIALANALAETLFGYAPGELAGQTMADLMPERFRARHAAHQGRFFAQPAKRPMGSGMDLLGRRRDGSEFSVEISLSPLATPEGPMAVSAIRDITERQEAAEKLAQMNRELQAALGMVKQLTGFLPICAFCKKIRDPRGQWQPLEDYIRAHSEAEFTHSLCPSCSEKHYGPAALA